MRLPPPPVSETVRPRRAGLSLPRDIILAPKRAFATIAITPEWLPAYGVILVTSLAVTALYAPALLHIAAVTPPPPGATAPRTTAAIAGARQTLVATYALGEATIPLLLILLTASALTTVARFKAQTTSYVTFLSLAANCMIPTMIGGLLSALMIRAHNPASFNDLRSLVVALPTNLAVFAAPGNEREVLFLEHFDLFDVWSYVLLAFGFATLTPVKFATALIIAFGLDFLFAVMF